MVVSAAVAFGLIGLSLVLITTRPVAPAQTRLARLCAGLVLAIAAGGVLDCLPGVSRRLDLSAWNALQASTQASDASHMSPFTAAGLACCALVLISMQTVRSRAYGWWVQLGTLLVVALGITGALAHPLELESLYPGSDVLQMPLYAALSCIHSLR